MQDVLRQEAESGGSAATPPPFQPFAARGRLWLRVALSLLLAVALLAAVGDGLRLVPEDPWVGAWPLLSYALCLVAYLAARSLRWQILVQPLGQVRLSDTTLVALAGFWWVHVLPLRLGELARPLMLRQRCSVSGSALLATVALERVVDGLMVCGLFFAARALGAGASLSLAGGEIAAGSDAAWILFAATLASAALASALLVLLLMALWPQRLGQLVAGPLRSRWPSLALRVDEQLTRLSEGLAALPNPSSFFAFLAATLAYWLINAIGMWVLAQGCGLTLSLVDMIAVMSVLNIALLVPGGPAQLGNFQLGMRWGLATVLSRQESLGAGSVFAFWLYTLQTIGIGGVGIAAQLLFSRRVASDADGAGGAHSTRVARGPHGASVTPTDRSQDA